MADCTRPGGALSILERAVNLMRLTSLFYVSIARRKLKNIEKRGPGTT